VVLVTDVAGAVDAVDVADVDADAIIIHRAQ
jgi:hypothetical protein